MPSEYANLRKALLAMQAAEGTKAMEKLIHDTLLNAATPGERHLARGLGSIQGVGTKSQLEILAAIGRLWDEREGRHYD